MSLPFTLAGKVFAMPGNVAALAEYYVWNDVGDDTTTMEKWRGRFNGLIAGIIGNAEREAKLAASLVRVGESLNYYHRLGATSALVAALNGWPKFQKAVLEGITKKSDNLLRSGDAKSFASLLGNIDALKEPKNDILQSLTAGITEYAGREGYGIGGYGAGQFNFMIKELDKLPGLKAEVVRRIRANIDEWSLAPESGIAIELVRKSYLMPFLKESITPVHVERGARALTLVCNLCLGLAGDFVHAVEKSSEFIQRGFVRGVIQGIEGIIAGISGKSIFTDISQRHYVPSNLYCVTDLGGKNTLIREGSIAGIRNAAKKSLAARDFGQYIHIYWLVQDRPDKALLEAAKDIQVPKNAVLIPAERLPSGSGPMLIDYQDEVRVYYNRNSKNYWPSREPLSPENLVRALAKTEGEGQRLLHGERTVIELAMEIGRLAKAHSDQAGLITAAHGLAWAIEETGFLKKVTERHQRRVTEISGAAAQAESRIALAYVALGPQRGVAFHQPAASPGAEKR